MVFVLLDAHFRGQQLVLSQSLSFICGFVVSFYLAKSWVFKTDGGILPELTKYVLLAVGNLLLSNALLAALIAYTGLHALASKFIVMAAIALWNYFIASRLIFAQRAK